MSTHFAFAVRQLALSLIVVLSISGSADCQWQWLGGLDVAAGV